MSEEGTQKPMMSTMRSGEMRRWQPINNHTSNSPGEASREARSVIDLV